MSVVFLDHFSGYDDAKINSFVHKTFDSMDIDFTEKKVLLKPNLLMAKKNKPVTTNLRIIESVIQYFIEKKSQVYIGDSPGIPINPSIIAKQLGLMALVKKYNITFVNFHSKPIEITRKENKLVKTFVVANILKKVDYVINLPKLKTHVQSIFTGGIKNLFGFVPGLQKPQFHFKFPKIEIFGQMIVDLASIVKPTFTLMDGIVAMQGEGPSNGTPYGLGVLIASQDIVAVDTLASSLIGLEPHKVPIINLAHKQGLGEIDIPKMDIRGVVDWKTLKASEYEIVQNASEMTLGPKGYVQKILKNVFTPKPVIDPDTCVKCGICVQVCPVDALSQKPNQVPVYDYNLCIRCYCCHEMCPEGAISKKDTIFSSLLFGKTIQKK